MIKIVNITGRVLDLAPDQAITVDKYNPLFNDPDKLLQDTSSPGTAPNTENNKLFFGMGQLAESPNSVYSMPVQFFVDDIYLSAGLISYRIATDPEGFEFNLEPNLTAVNALLKNIRLTELRTEDADYSMVEDSAAFAAMMLDTCKNPDNYPFIYFPVANAGWFTDPDAHSYGFVNYFNPVDQDFIIVPPDGSPDAFYCVKSPYFKLTYVLKLIADYLGFTVAGSFFTSADTKNLCIYTRRTDTRAQRLPSTMYMPNMLISDFLKFIRERLHLPLDFDLRNGVSTVETFKTIAARNDVYDLTKYVSTTMEQEVPAGQSFTVTLKTDEQDDALAVTDGNGNVTHPPLFRLVAGAGDTAQELDCSTTKGVDLSTPGEPGAKYASVSQTVYNSASFVLGPPADITYTDVNDPSTLNNWPLRLINYLGFQPVTGGGSFPNSEPFDLNNDDINYYRFCNDSKRLIITLDMPPAILAAVKLTGKFGHRTAGNNYITYILEQVSYDAYINQDLIAVKMYVRTLSFDPVTKVGISALSTVQPTGATEDWTILFKANFDPLINGISQLNIAVVPNGISATTYTVAPITNPTNLRGAGGVAVPLISSIGTYDDSIEVRITQGVPKYILHMGQRFYFTRTPNYYFCTLDTTEDTFYPFDGFFDTYTIFF